jgi:transcriptional regulator with XRE-family HTH domain
MSFGKKLERLLNENEMSKNAFAKKIGISQTSISNYIRDVSDPSISVIRKINIQL